MVASLITSFVGMVLSFSVGHFYLKLESLDILFCLLSANLACFISLFLVLQIDQLPPLLKSKLSGSLKTWSILISIYLGFIVGICPILQNLRSFFYLIVPLILSSGFGIIAFGPIRDRMIWSQNKKVPRYRSHLQSSS